MAYSETKVLAPTTTPDRHNSQPTGFSGLREATIAPTVASITTNVLPNHHSKTGVFGWERLRTTRRALSAVSATVIAQSDQASRVAARRLIRVTSYPLPHRSGAAATERHGRAASSPSLPPPVRRSAPPGQSPLVACWRTLPGSFC